MSDVDRLRAAADRLDEGRRSKRTAALLRAVARWPHDEYRGNCLLECRACAALDVADTVLEEDRR